MISVKNLPRLKRNSVIAHFNSVTGLLILLAGVVISLFVQSLASLSLGIMVIGLFLSLIGIYVANRWVKKPRPEDVLDRELKGFTNAYRLYHYPDLPYDHVLLSPFGATIIQTVNLEGEFTYQDGKWHERFNLGRALRYIVEEHLGNPISDSQECMASLAGHLKEATGSKVPVDGVVLFIHPGAVIEIHKAPMPVLTPNKLRSAIDVKAEKLPEEVYEKAKEYLDQKTHA